MLELLVSQMRHFSKRIKFAFAPRQGETLTILDGAPEDRCS
jgi:hypothetical protein